MFSLVRSRQYLSPLRYVLLDNDNGAQLAIREDMVCLRITSSHSERSLNYRYPTDYFVMSVLPLMIGWINRSSIANVQPCQLREIYQPEQVIQTSIVEIGVVQVPGSLSIFGRHGMFNISSQILWIASRCYCCNPRSAMVLARCEIWACKVSMRVKSRFLNVPYCFEFANGVDCDSGRALWISRQ